MHDGPASYQAKRVKLMVFWAVFGRTVGLGVRQLGNDAWKLVADLLSHVSHDPIPGLSIDSVDVEG